MNKQRPVHNITLGELGTMLKNNSKDHVGNEANWLSYSSSSPVLC